MNFEEYFLDYLLYKGFGEEQAKEVMSLAKEDELLESMKDRWYDPITDYPDAMLITLRINIDSVAQKWKNGSLANEFMEAFFKSAF